MSTWALQNAGRVIASNREIDGKKLGVIIGVDGYGDDLLAIVELHETGASTLKNVKRFRTMPEARRWIEDNGSLINPQVKPKY